MVIPLFARCMIIPCFCDHEENRYTCYRKQFPQWWNSLWCLC